MPNNKVLNQEDRSRLDGIVNQMTQNNESEEDIQFVVDDFKNKYGVLEGRFQDKAGAEKFLMDYYEENVNLFPEVPTQEGPLPDIQGIQSVPGSEAVVQQTEVPQQVIEDVPVDIPVGTKSISEGFIKDREAERQKMMSVTPAEEFLGQYNFGDSQANVEEQNRIKQNLSKVYESVLQEGDDEASKKILDLLNSDVVDPLEVGNTLRELEDKNIGDPNLSEYKSLMSTRDAYDPEIQKEKEAMKSHGDKMLKPYLDRKSEVSDSLKKLKEISLIMSENPELQLSENEESMIQELIQDKLGDITYINQTINKVREADPTIGMTEEEVLDYKAEQSVRDRYSSEMSDLMDYYGMDYKLNDTVKDMNWEPARVKELEDKVIDYMENLKGIDVEEYSNTAGKSSPEIVKDYLYKKHWPEFKQMLRNIDPDLIQGGVKSIMNQDLSDLERTALAGNKEIKDALLETIALYYMAEEGKSPSDLFATQSQGVTGTLLSAARGGGSVIPALLDGELMGTNIRNSMMSKSDMSSATLNALNNAGVQTPEDISKWSEKTNWDRVNNLTEMLSRMGMESALFSTGVGALGGVAKGSQVLSGIKGAKNIKNLERLSSGLNKAIAGTLRTANTSTNPLAKYSAKLLLAGGNAVKEGVRYELIGQTFDDEAWDFTSGAAGTLARGPVNTVFNWLGKKGAPASVKNFFSKGLGEVTEESAQEITQSDLKSFLKTMEDPEEAAWFLGSTFAMGAVMGGNAGNDMQDMALEHYKDLGPEQQAWFEEFTGIRETRENINQEVYQDSKSDFVKELEGTSGYTSEQISNADVLATEQTNNTLNELGLQVSDAKINEIKQENIERAKKGFSPMDGVDVLDIINKPTDVSGKYSDEMLEVDRVKTIMDDINDYRNENNNVLEQIEKVPNAATRKILIDGLDRAFQDRKVKLESKLVEAENNLSEMKGLEEKFDPRVEESKFKKKLREQRYRFSDRHIYMRNFIDKIREQGGQVTSETDVYKKLGVASSKVRAEQSRVLEPIINYDNENSVLYKLVNDDNFSNDSNDIIKDIDKFLMSRHANEANRQIEQTKGDDYYSGISDEEAKYFEDELKQQGKWDKLMELESDVRSIIDYTLDLKLNNDLIDHKTYSNLKSTYKNYIPLKLDKDYLNFNYKDNSSNPRISGGINDGVKKRGGTSKENILHQKSPFLTAIQDFMATQNMVAENNIRKSFARLVSDNNFNFEGIEITDQAPSSLRSGNSIDFMEDGEKKWIVIEDDKDWDSSSKEISSKLLRNLKEGVFDKEQYSEQITKIMDGLTWYGNFIRDKATVSNPAFIAKAGLYDFQTMYTRLESVGIKDVGLMEMTKNVWGAMKALPSIIKDYKKGKDLSGEWGQMFEEATGAGGLTTHRDLTNKNGDLTKTHKKGEEVFVLPGDLKSNSKAGKWFHKTADKINKVHDFIRDVAEVQELSFRLATYKLGRERGMNRLDASDAARNITVDFEKKGKWSKMINRAYLFSSAATNGLVNMVEAVGDSKRARRIMLTMASVGMLEGFLADMMGGDEEEGEIYEFDKSRNINLLNTLSSDKGDYFKIPLAHGLDVPKAWGGVIYEAMKGDKDKTAKALTNAALKSIEAANPVQSATTLQTISPSIFDPLVQIGENKNYFGAPVYPESMRGEDVVDSWADPVGHTSALATNIAKGINTLSFGSKTEPGLVDLHPGTVQTLLDGYITGGTGRFWSDVTALGQDIITDKFDWKETKLPLASGFYRFKGGGDFAKTKSFYDFVNGSRVKDYSDEEIGDILTYGYELVDMGLIDDYNYVNRKVNQVYKNQQIKRFADENNMGFNEAKAYLKSLGQ